MMVIEKVLLTQYFSKVRVCDTGQDNSFPYFSLSQHSPPALFTKTIRSTYSQRTKSFIILLQWIPDSNISNSLYLEQRNIKTTHGIQNSSASRQKQRIPDSNFTILQHPVWTSSKLLKSISNLANDPVAMVSIYSITETSPAPPSMFLKPITPGPMSKMLTRRHAILPPTTTEINTAISTLSHHLSHLPIEYGLISSSAILQYASSHSLPYQPSSNPTISLILQPSTFTTSSALTKFLCRPANYRNFTSRKEEGGCYVIVKRKGHSVVYVKVEIFDHWECAWRREEFDLRLKDNETVRFQLWNSRGVKTGGVNLLNPGWLLKDKISTYSEDKSYHDILTLCDILKLENQKLKIRGHKGREELRAFLQHFRQVHDWRILKGVIDCPEVLGPWYLRLDVKWIALVVAVLVIPVLLDYFTSV